MQTLIAEDVVSDLNARFETSTPEEIVRWAILDSGLDRIAIASAFQTEGTALIHMASRIQPDVPILFLETGYHFAETLVFKERLADQLGLNVVDLTGDYTVESQADAFGSRLYERDPNACCELNKVVPFARALRDFDAWMTSMRRDSAWTRKHTPIVSQTELEPGKTLVKINPVANWTHRDAWAYLKEHDLPHNPLYDLGYASIGCAPCTRMVFAGEDERAGRWSGLLKTECGIHVREARVQDETDDDADCPPSETAT
ncbi:MAG: phosphoadenylyl-sulfate reductase [Actinobacteria bacterium]|nr:MAG: phosphoadenylyl-sulfate reductase [Actinomycetota bacterium]